MSMPQYIEIAVVGETESRVKEMIRGVSLPTSGIAPKYHLISLALPSEGICQSFSKLNYDRVLYWVALDDKSFITCQKATDENRAKDGFCRGFYDTHLPEVVVQVRSNEQLINETHKIAEAFCATS
jgi:hypothetical protein